MGERESEGKREWERGKARVKDSEGEGFTIKCCPNLPYRV